MDRTQYWELIEQARDAVDSHDSDEVAEAFVTALSEHEPEAIADAWLRHHELLNEAYSWDVWGAAYLAMGGCSDDSFGYFRSWLITRGRDAFDAVLEDPDSLIEYLPEDYEDGDALECEDLATAPLIAYEQVTGESMPDHRDAPDQPDLGEEFDFEDEAEMRARYPRLSERFLPSA